MRTALERAGRAIMNPRRVREKLLSWAAGSRGQRHSDVGAAHLWQHKRQFQIDFLRSQGLLPQHRLIDVGCGTLRGGVALIDYLDTGRYTGIEVRTETLEEGRRELAEAGLEGKQPNLVHAEDLGVLSLDVRADYIWAFSVLIHMSDDVLERAVGFCARHLAPDGVFLANVNVGEDTQVGSWRGFPVVRHPASFYEDLCSRHGLRCEDLGSLADLGERDEGRLSQQDPAARRMYRFRLA